MSACTKCDHQNAADALFCARCGTQVEAIETLAVGTMVGGGRYRVDALLGVGGMGSVYKATDIGLQRTVALKLLNPELTAHPTARRRMLQEARILARIHHPNVVQVRSVFEEGSVLAMELEFMPGGDLLGAIPVGGMAEEETVRVMKDVLAGLQALHEAGLVHRDVKPDNVLLTADGAAKVTDLGVARDSSAREKTKLGAVLGTPEYMSPEQIQGQPVDRRADLYSAGILLFRMLSGGLPYQASSEFEWQEAHVRIAPDLETLRTKGSDALVGVVKKALAKKPEERWQTAEDMKEALAPLPTGGGDSMAQVAAAQAVLERLEADRARRSEPATPGDQASRQARLSKKREQRLATAAQMAETSSAASDQQQNKIIEKLERLAALLQAGLLTRPEFDAQKTRLLAEPTTDETPSRSFPQNAHHPVLTQAEEPNRPRNTRNAAVDDRTQDDRSGDLEAPQFPEGPVSRTRGDAGERAVVCPSGTFEMGGADSGAHNVTLTRSFEIWRTPVTQAQYEALMGHNPSHFHGPDHPVESVSWTQAAQFCNAHSRASGLPDAYEIRTIGDSTEVNWHAPDNGGWRLPTEAEWEYAARAGATTDRYGDVNAIAWHAGNSDKSTQLVALKQPNSWGLHDMLGNVWEWVWDRHEAFSSAARTDPSGPATGSDRVLRGGSWNYGPEYSTTVFRIRGKASYRLDVLGFRIARSCL